MRLKSGNKYIFKNNTTLREKKFLKNFKNYEQILEELLKSKTPTNIERLKNTKNELKNCFLPEEGLRNIIKFSSVKDKKIGSGQDSVVFEFQNISGWIYKEGQKANKENLEYIVKKYRIFKKYLGNLIPDSYFVIGEAYEKFFKRGFKNGAYIQSKLITIQRKVKGKDLTKLKKEEILNKNFLQKLGTAHRKYILLKLFIEQIANKLDIKDKLDVKLDLGPLSKIDKGEFSNPEFVLRNLTSPNIMYDEKNIYFIDFGFGSWNKEKEINYQELMKEENYKKWKDILEKFGLD